MRLRDKRLCVTVHRALSNNITVEWEACRNSRWNRAHLTLRMPRWASPSDYAMRAVTVSRPFPRVESLSGSLLACSVCC